MRKVYPNARPELLDGEKKRIETTTNYVSAASLALWVATVLAPNVNSVASGDFVPWLAAAHVAVGTAVCVAVFGLGQRNLDYIDMKIIPTQNPIRNWHLKQAWQEEQDALRRAAWEKRRQAIGAKQLKIRAVR